MSRPPARTVLLIEANPADTEVLAADLIRLGGLKVVRVRSLDAALEILATMPVDAVVGVHAPPTLDGLAMLRALHSEDQRQEVAAVILAAHDAVTIRIAGWREGVQAILTWPADPADVAGALVVLLERRAAERARRVRSETADVSIAPLVRLLTTTLDAAIPGSARRGDELVTGALAVARELEVPSDFLPSMEYAARLHEIGRIAVVMLPESGERAFSLPGDVTLAGAVLLREIPALAEAATLLEGMGANWDGSGSPTDLQQGQIPMRSRILRAVRDLLAVSSRGATRLPLAEAMQVLEPRIGTWYDPAVLASLEVLVSMETNPNWLAHQELVPVHRLREGMVLAADLHTASGVKLLSGGSVLNGPSLELIRRRHGSDPVVHGVPIRPSSE